jgi:hypothetical protein
MYDVQALYSFIERLNVLIQNILMSIFLSQNILNDKDIAKYCHISLSRALNEAYPFQN